MRAPVSVIVPTLNSETGLPICFNGLGEGLEAGLIRELVVSDGGSGDGTMALAESAGAVMTTGPVGRGGQLRRGAENAGGEWFLFVHSDTYLSPGWTGAVLAHLGGEGAGFFKLAFDDNGLRARLVAGWANLRSRIFGLPYGDQGLLISRQLYEKIGGFRDMPLMEDVDIARRLKGQMVMLDGVAVTSAEKYRRQGWMRRGTRNLLTLLRYFMGADVEKLNRHYRREN